MPFGIGRKSSPSDQNGPAPVNIHDLATLEKEVASFPLATAPKSATLSAQELYLLRQQGFEPGQVVFGNVVYSMGLSGLFRTVRRAFKQGEMPDFTRMNNDAREIARNRMLLKAQALGAVGVVGVVISVHEYGDFLEAVFTATTYHLIQTDQVKMPELPIAVST